MPRPSAPGASAAALLPAFRAALGAGARAAPELEGAHLVAALRRAGFPIRSLQVTADRTTIGAPTPSIQIGLPVRASCLLGQVDRATGAVRAVVAPPVNGRCLIGDVRTIDD